MGDADVSDGDRSRAKKLVQQAAAEGRIIEFDRDKRLEQIEGAQSQTELQMITHDLVPQGFAPPVPPVVPPAISQSMPQPNPAAGTPPAFAPPVNYGPSAGAGTGAAELAQLQAMAANPGGVVKARAARGCLGCLIPLVIAVIVIGAASLAIFSSVRDSVDSVRDMFNSAQGATDSQTLAPGVEPTDDSDINLLSRGGYSDLIDAIKAQSGSSKVFSVVLYPTYAVVDVPVDATSGRVQSFYWNGVLDTFGSKGTTTDQRFDLNDFDADVIVRLVKKAVAGVDQPNSWYAILGSPGSDGTEIRAFASNEFNETAYIFATRTGKIITRSESLTTP